jgi:hypothetical protein
VPFTVAHDDFRGDVPKFEAAPVGKRAFVRFAVELPTVNVPDALPRAQHVRTQLAVPFLCGEYELTTIDDRLADERDHIRHFEHHDTPLLDMRSTQ